MATTKQIERKVKDLTSTADKWLQAECRRLVASGAVDVDSAENNYRLPKNLMVVALENLARQYSPLNPNDMKEIKNLRKF
jgi:hypothetical protein